MASKFKGRDYSTLRQEIIEFLRTKLPNDWDYTNLSDPVVVYAESLAQLGDQLHYTIDELRRECDVATAKRASSIYSYAMREGYKMMLPRASFGTITVNTTKEQDGLLHLNLKQFDEIKIKPLNESLYVADSDPIDVDLHSPIDEKYIESLSDYSDDSTKRMLYKAYIDDAYSRTQRVRVVLGKKAEFSFTYNDINRDSTVELPDPMIDRDLVRLQYTNSSLNNVWETITYVDDVISSGFQQRSFTLTPKFIGGAITLNIEFPTSYNIIFSNDFTTKFRFEYIKIRDVSVEPKDEYQDNAKAIDFGNAITVVPGHENDQEIVDNGIQYRVNLGDGIKGYTEYESAYVTRDNYKKFVQNYSALLTKDDYTNYIRAMTTSHCDIYDHGDMYKSPQILPDDANLIPRVIYAITDSKYSGRENLWYDLKERSSRSDCIVMIPYGIDPYMIVVKADCYLVGTSITSIAASIENALLEYYSGFVGDKIPKLSMIDYLVHKASDKVIKMNSLIVRDSTYGSIDDTFNKAIQLDNENIDALYNALVNENIDYKSPLIDSSKENEPDDYRYYLRGKLYKDINSGKIYTLEELNKVNESLSTPLEVSEIIYNKYPRLTYDYYNENTHNIEYASEDEYRDYPDSFPKIYNTKSETLTVITDYDELIKHQVVYGELDSKDWDVADSKIFSLSNKTYTNNKAYTTEWVKFTYHLNDGVTISDITAYVESKNTTYSKDSYHDGDIIKTKTETDFGQGSKIYIYSEPIPNDNKSYWRINNQGNPIELDYDITLDDAIPYDLPGTVDISDEYKLHHYMVPVISKVVVLIKSVNAKP